MQIKTVLLLVVIGAVAVLAHKGSSEEDKNGYDTLQVWPFNRPGRGPKPFKGPKHQVFVVGRPQYMQPSMYPQYPQYVQKPEYQVEQQIGLLEVQRYLEGIDRQMQEASANAYREFQRIESIIDNRRRNLEEMMKKQFQALEVALEAKQAKEIQQALKEGKDELKIQECLANEEQEARAEMDADIQRTRDCLNDATERARKTLNDARNAYTETSFTTSLQAKEWAQKIRSCAESRNNQCVQEGKMLINEETKRTVEEGNQHIRSMQEPLQHQMIQMQYCNENFVDDLRDMRTAYSTMVKRCIVASETEETEDYKSDEEDEEENKSDVNVQVKPEVEAQGEAEVEAQVEA